MRGTVPAQAEIALARYGPNALRSAHNVNGLRLLLKQFQSLITLILIGVAMLSLFLGNHANAIIILAIVLVSSVLGFWQERGAANAVARLLAVVQTKAMVLRDGNAVTVPFADIVPGNLVLIEAGATIPSDCLLLESHDGLVVVAAGALIYGSMRWQSATDTMHATLEAARLPIRPKTYSASELIGLPAPVQRYFRAALTDGQPMIVAVSVEHTGTFNMNVTDEDQWRPFSSTQRVIAQRPGFDWEARIAMLPGLPVRVHDAYIAGEGTLHASLFGWCLWRSCAARPRWLRASYYAGLPKVPGIPRRCYPARAYIGRQSTTARPRQPCTMAQHP